MRWLEAMVSEVLLTLFFAVVHVAIQTLEKFLNSKMSAKIRN